MITFNKKYFSIAGIIFTIEILIAAFVNDDFIRPYFGDTLATIFLYSLIKSFIKIDMLAACVAALSFSYFIELLQFLNIIDAFGLQDNQGAILVIGKNASWLDLLAYTFGAILILLTHQTQIFITKKTTYENS